ncbi:energy transducer TonB, partial [Klebsiella pneumoniae]|uniref:energy transducer TonB n=2 Tax=Pseudomonadota TaxID=1224 RepID=UPI0027305E9F
MSLLRSATIVAASLMLALAAHATPKVVKKVPPDFPREASQKGISTGVVKAKLSIDANGSVTDVEILEAE